MDEDETECKTLFHFGSYRFLNDNLKIQWGGQYVGKSLRSFTVFLKPWVEKQNDEMTI